MKSHRVWILGSLLVSTLVLAADGPAKMPVPLSPPNPTAIPSGPLGDAIRYGQQIVTDTQGTVKSNVGNGLNCVSCHLNAGRTAYAAPLVGLTGMFPEYRARGARVESLADRINDCFLRSMNGKALAPNGREMIGLLSYVSWLSQGVPIGSEVEGRGFRDISAPGPANATRGKAIYATKCAACHGADGQGLMAAGKVVFPPLWGPQSFNVGAGMARLSVAAAFVQAKMPVGNAGTLTNQEAFDVAAYFTTQPRPPFAGAKQDWPKGGRPPDAR